MKEIFEYLDRNDNIDSKVALQRIQIIFDLSNIQTVLAYKSWKESYMKPQYSINPKAPYERFRG